MRAYGEEIAVNILVIKSTFSTSPRPPLLIRLIERFYCLSDCIGRFHVRHPVGESPYILKGIGDLHGDRVSVPRAMGPGEI